MCAETFESSQQSLLQEEEDWKGLKKALIKLGSGELVPKETLSIFFKDRDSPSGKLPPLYDDQWLRYRCPEWVVAYHLQKGATIESIRDRFFVSRFILSPIIYNIQVNETTEVKKSKNFEEYLTAQGIRSHPICHNCYCELAFHEYDVFGRRRSDFFNNIPWKEQNISLCSLCKEIKEAREGNPLIDGNLVLNHYLDFYIQHRSPPDGYYVGRQGFSCLGKKLQDFDDLYLGFPISQIVIALHLLKGHSEEEIKIQFKLTSKGFNDAMSLIARQCYDESKPIFENQFPESSHTKPYETPGPCWEKINASKLLDMGIPLYFSLRFSEGQIIPHVSEDHSEGSQIVNKSTIKSYIEEFGWPQSQDSNFITPSQAKTFLLEDESVSEEHYPLYDERWLEFRSPEVVLSFHILSGEVRDELRNGFGLKNRSISRIFSNIEKFVTTQISGEETLASIVDLHTSSSTCHNCGCTLNRYKLDVFGRSREKYFVPHYILPLNCYENGECPSTNILASCLSCEKIFQKEKKAREHIYELEASDGDHSIHSHQFISFFIKNRAPQKGYSFTSQNLWFDGKELAPFHDHYLSYPNPQLVLSYHFIKKYSKKEIQLGFGITSKTFERILSKIKSESYENNVFYLPRTTSRYYKLMENQDLQKCVKCGTRLNTHSQDCFGRQRPDCLTAYHIYPIAKYPELQFEPTNLKASCQSCNDLLGCSIDEEFKHTVKQIKYHEVGSHVKSHEPGPCWSSINAGELLESGKTLHFSMKFNKGSLEPHISTHSHPGSQEVNKETIKGYIKMYGWPQSDLRTKYVRTNPTEEKVADTIEMISEIPVKFTIGRDRLLNSLWTTKEIRKLCEDYMSVLNINLKSFKEGFCKGSSKIVKISNLLSFFSSHPCVNHRFQAVDVSPLNIKHMVSLLMLASTAACDSIKVRAIEGVTVRTSEIGSRVKEASIGDMDLILDRIENILCVDIKAQKNYKTKYQFGSWSSNYVWSREMTESHKTTMKYQIPNAKYLCASPTYLKYFDTEFQMDFEGFELESLSIPSFRFENEFKNSVAAIKILQTLTMDDIKQSVSHLAKKYLDNPLDASPISNQKAYKESYVNDAIRMLANNSRKTMMSFDKLQLKLKKTQGKLKQTQLQLGYDQHLKVTLKPVIRHVPLLKGPVNSISDAIRECLRRKEFPLMVWLVSLCVDESWHPTQTERASAREMQENGQLCTFDLSTLNQISMRSVLRPKGEKYPSVVKLKTKSKIIEFFKGANENRTDYLSAVYKNRHRKHVHLENLYESESLVQEDLDLLSQKGSSLELLETKLLWTMLDQLKQDTEVDKLSKNILSQTFRRIQSTNCHDLMHQISQIFMLSALSKKKIKPVRSAKSWKGDSSVKKNEITLSVSNFQGRLGLSFNTISSMDANDSWQFTSGLFVNYDLHMAWPRRGTMSEPISITTAQEDWGVLLYEKSLSWTSMRLDTHSYTAASLISGEKIPDPSQNVPIASMRDMVFGCLIAILNDSKFSQASENVRYFFVNATGISGDVHKLYEKILFFEPTNLLSNCYMTRLHKMVMCFSIVKASGQMDKLLIKTKNPEPIKGKTHYYSDWNVAFPHEAEPSLSQSSIFNSLYVCRALTMFRNTKMTSESQVVSKALKNRREFEEKYKDPTMNLKTKQDLLELWKKIVVDSKGGAFQPDFGMVLLSVAHSIYSTWELKYEKNKKSGRITPSNPQVRNIVDGLYSLSQVLPGMDYSDMFNNRGSVRDEGRTGLIQSHILSKKALSERKGVYQFMTEEELRSVELDFKKKVSSGNIDRSLGRKDHKTESLSNKKPDFYRITQNQRCYEGLLKNLSQLAKSESDLPTSVLSFKDYKRDIINNHKNLLTKDDINSIKNFPNSVWPVLLFNLERNAPSIAKMVHKDQIGPREIAVLNTHLRIVCKFIEDGARQVEKVEQSLGDFTNLIDHDDKQKVVTEGYRKDKSSSLEEGTGLVFDNADNSQWGPSMIPWVLFISLASRTTDKLTINLYESSLRSFSNKVIKLPDVLYQSFRDIHSKMFDLRSEENPFYKNAILKTAKEMSMMDSQGLGSSENQIIYSPEGMFMGTLGSLSSVFHSDAMRLSAALLEEAMSPFNLMIRSYCTSDDSSRIISYKRNEHLPDLELYSQFKKGTARKLITIVDQYHLFVLNKVGIKRNTVKSFYSRYIFEFNSVFYTVQGIFAPLMKSRLSYIDYSHHRDLYLSGLESLSQSQEYLRANGGVIGSYWIFLINNLLHIKQFQLASFTLECPDQIHVTPMELGGIIRPDPIRQLTLNTIGRLKQNYGLSISNFITCRSNFSLEMLMSKALDRPHKLSEFNTEWSRHNYIPSVGRSGIAFVGQHVDKKVRILRETMETLESRDLLPLLSGRVGATQIKGLLACVMREASTESKSASIRYRDSQIPEDAVLFVIRSDCYRQLLGRKDDNLKVSRKDIESLRLKWFYLKKESILTNNTEHRWGQITMKRPTRDYGELYIRTQEQIDKIDIELRQVELGEKPLIRSNQVLYTTPVDISYAKHSFTLDSVKKFEEEVLPMVIEDMNKPHKEQRLSLLAYLENKNLIHQKHYKLQHSKFKIKISTLSSDVGYSYNVKAMLSNYCEGLRLVAREIPSHFMQDLIQWTSYLRAEMSLVKNCYNKNSSVIHIPHLKGSQTIKEFGEIDITNLLEWYWGSNIKNYSSMTSFQEYWHLLGSMRVNLLFNSSVLSKHRSDRANLSSRLTESGNPLLLEKVNTEAQRYAQITEGDSKGNKLSFHHNQMIFKGDKYIKHSLEEYNSYKDTYSYAFIPKHDAVLRSTIRPKHRHSCLYLYGESDCGEELVMISLLEPSLKIGDSSVKIISMGPVRSMVAGDSFLEELDSIVIPIEVKHKLDAESFFHQREYDLEELEEDEDEGPETLGLAFIDDEEERLKYLNEPGWLTFPTFDPGEESEPDPEPPSIFPEYNLDAQSIDVKTKTVIISDYNNVVGFMTTLNVPWVKAIYKDPSHIASDDTRSEFEKIKSSSTKGVLVWKVDFGVTLPESLLLKLREPSMVCNVTDQTLGVLGTVFKLIQRSHSDNQIPISDFYRLVYKLQTCINRN